MLTIKTDHLTVPHPEMLGRSFVLEPAAEIAADCAIHRKHVTQISHEKCCIKKTPTANSRGSSLALLRKAISSSYHVLQTFERTSAYKRYVLASL